uniref:Uncharacterized protein n=1 Tax=Anopheles maculatus TaxID=74869 RepID=A0A182S9F3_9DIPT
MELPVSYTTVVARAQLAQKIYEMGREELRRCEVLIHEQHLQQQGWAAVVANMEDMIKVFQERSEYFNRNYEEQLRLHEEQMVILQNFDKSLQQLADIPILSSLMENAESRPYGVFDEVFNPSVTTNSGASRTASNNEQSEPGGSGAIESTNVAPPAAVAAEVKTGDDPATQSAHSSSEIPGAENIAADIKVVKGLEERLRGLDELLANAKKLLQDQNELAQGILKNQDRANKIGDVSVLPDLCAMHQNTLGLMKKNHIELLEYRRRCTVAKDELGFNLTKRIKYIMNVETRVQDLDSTLQLYHTSLQRLQKHLSIIEQIHMVPCIYVSAVTEVVRRRMFSSAFLRWASDLACRLMAIHNEEVARRQEFSSVFEGHFLSTLFPGMNDMPPSYAIQAPSVFDSSLPALDKQDLEELSRHLPELTEKIPLPNIASVIDFFQTRSVEQQQLQQQNEGSGADKDDASVRSKGNATASSSNENVESASNVPDQQTGVKESDKIGTESETDTEDYEKVQNQSPADGGSSRQEEIPKMPVPVTCTVATCTEPVET